jgi:hypothetical protein
MRGGKRLKPLEALQKSYCRKFERCLVWMKPNTVLIQWAGQFCSQQHGRLVLLVFQDIASGLQLISAPGCEC